VNIVMTTSSAAVCRNGDIVVTYDLFKTITFQSYFIICIVKEVGTRKNWNQTSRIFGGKAQSV
jgi:hypothetical protein